MRRRAQLAMITFPPLIVAVVSCWLVAIDREDAAVYLSLIMVSLLTMLGAVVSYLHRLLYGEDG